MLQYQNDPRQQLRELIELLTQDPRVKVIYAQQTKGRIIVHTVVSDLEGIANNPPVARRRGSPFEILYLGTGSKKPPKDSEEVYRRPSD